MVEKSPVLILFVSPGLQNFPAISVFSTLAGDAPGSSASFFAVSGDGARYRVSDGSAVVPAFVCGVPRFRRFRIEPVFPSSGVIYSGRSRFGDVSRDSLCLPREVSA